MLMGRKVGQKRNIIEFSQKVLAKRCRNEWGRRYPGISGIFCQHLQLAAYAPGSNGVALSVGEYKTGLYLTAVQPGQHFRRVFREK